MWRLRAGGFAIAAVLGAAAALGLFFLMQSLVRAPREAPAVRRAVPVEWIARVPARESVPRPLQSEAVPRPPQRPGRAARPAPAPLPGPATVAPAAGSGRTGSNHGRPVVWRGALDDYLRRRDRAARMFAPPPSLPRPPPSPSPLELPERMRLGTGGEIDRIGERCYAVPSDIAYGDEAGGNPSMARVMHAMQSLFAHEIACDPGAGKAAGDDFLEKLRRLAPAAPPRTR